METYGCIWNGHVACLCNAQERGILGCHPTSNQLHSFRLITNRPAKHGVMEVLKKSANVSKCCKQLGLPKRRVFLPQKPTQSPYKPISQMLEHIKSSIKEKAKKEEININIDIDSRKRKAEDAIDCRSCKTHVSTTNRHRDAIMAMPEGLDQ